METCDKDKLIKGDACADSADSILRFCYQYDIRTGKMKKRQEMRKRCQALVMLEFWRRNLGLCNTRPTPAGPEQKRWRLLERLLDRPGK